jgi:hypothetical protein
MDIGDRGTKHITAVKGDINRMNKMYSRVITKGLGVDIRCQSRHSPNVPFNLNNVAFPRSSFVDGRLLIAGEWDPTMNNEGSSIGHIEVRYQAEDKRFTRGTRGVPEGKGEEEQ